jgi:hypothetical protein
VHDDIVEVAQAANLNIVNMYLDGGYRLLNIGFTSKSARHPEASHPQLYVRRRTLFVLGRTAETPHIDYPEGASPA